MTECAGSQKGLDDWMVCPMSLVEKVCRFGKGIPYINAPTAAMTPHDLLCAKITGAGTAFVASERICSVS